MFYDPLLVGSLEKIEHQVDLLSEIILSAEVSQIVLVFSRIQKATEDKQIRRKQKLLQGVTPQHFGVSTYLLLNEQSPILEIANERDTLLLKVDLRLSRHTTQRNNTLMNIFLNNDVSKDDGE